MVECIARLRGRPEYSGLAGGVRLWRRTGPDLVRGAVREHAAAVLARVGAWRSGTPATRKPSYGLALLAGAAVWLLYVLTLAPTTAFWDAGEYITAAHTLGLPHPPGNPLFVL